MRSLIAALTVFALGTLAVAVTHPKGATTPTQCTPPCVAPTCVRT